MGGRLRQRLGALFFVAIIACGSQVECVTSGGDTAVCDLTDNVFARGRCRINNRAHTTCYDEQGIVISRDGEPVERP